MGFVGWIVAAILAVASYRIYRKYQQVCHKLEAAGMRIRDLEPRKKTVRSDIPPPPTPPVPPKLQISKEDYRAPLPKLEL